MPMFNWSSSIHSDIANNGCMIGPPLDSGELKAWFELQSIDVIDQGEHDGWAIIRTLPQYPNITAFVKVHFYYCYLTDNDMMALKMRFQGWDVSNF